MTTAIRDEQGPIPLGSVAEARYLERFTKSDYQRSLLGAMEQTFSRSRSG
jgi:hypothetical protein